MSHGADALSFTCNICGERVLNCPIDKIDREIVSCQKCGSTVRGRAIIDALSRALFGRSVPLPDFPLNMRINGVGLSDWHGYAPLAEKLDYRNTFLHRAPRLDILQPETEERFEFLISSEVFEHVPPPAQRAFDGAFNLLKPGGHLILTVPYKVDGATDEHFETLYDYKIVEIGNERVLLNRRRDGKFEVFTDLCFHGGDGETLEMRVFSEADILRSLKAAGFINVRIMRENVLEFGILHKHLWSLPIVATRPN